mmetsp:Transcript_10787/g.30591  ORF Transcript_10787/g.30591 Transcript_10787/m.30591 type:complete len:229 (+) Transcript_10787:430-1116(+)
MEAIVTSHNCVVKNEGEDQRKETGGGNGTGGGTIMMGMMERIGSLRYIVAVIAVATNEAPEATEAMVMYLRITFTKTLVSSLSSSLVSSSAPKFSRRYATCCSSSVSRNGEIVAPVMGSRTATSPFFWASMPLWMASCVAFFFSGKMKAFIKKPTAKTRTGNTTKVMPMYRLTTGLCGCGRLSTGSTNPRALTRARGMAVAGIATNFGMSVAYTLKMPSFRTPYKNSS